MTTERYEELPARLEELVEHYLAIGCPCRFPRFRAHQSRDGAQVGAPAWTTPEQQLLIAIFDRRVPLTGKRTKGTGHIGACALCGASVVRWGAEPFRDAWLDCMDIRPNRDAPELGAPVELPLPRATQFYSVGPGTADAALTVSFNWPKLPLDEWLAYMRALRG